MKISLVKSLRYNFIRHLLSITWRRIGSVKSTGDSPLRPASGTNESLPGLGCGSNVPSLELCGSAGRCPEVLKMAPLPSMLMSVSGVETLRQELPALEIEIPPYRGTEAEAKWESREN